ncbi:unnamed protein product, partial [Fusarium langsethiae]
MRPSTTLRLL